MVRSAHPAVKSWLRPCLSRYALVIHSYHIVQANEGEFYSIKISESLA